MEINLPNLGDSILEYDIEQTNEINGMNEDTGWLNIPIASGFTSDSFQYRRFRGVIYIKGIVRGTFWNNVDTIAGTLPVGFRPPSLLISGAGVQGGYGGLIQIHPNGEISFNHQASMSLAWASSTLCFIGS